MPLEKKEDFAGGDVKSPFCRYCVNDDGSVKSCEKIFEGGARFFMGNIGADRKMAEKATRKNMNRLSYWKNKDCAVLQGEEATDEEFAEIMKKLG
jgi:hypothetical protein